MKTILFDADDTLVDYKADAVRAFHAALQAVGRDTEEAFSACLRFDYGNWDKVGLSDVHLSHIQDNYHTLYRGHVTAIFDHVDQTVGLGGRAREAEARFLAEFAKPGTAVDGALETVQFLRTRYRVYAATNGLASLQRTRLSAFGLDGIFVSEELGSIKPSKAFFEKALSVLDMPPSECLMVGDSVSSDIAGALAAGIPCILFNRRRGPCPDGVRQIFDLRELRSL